MHSTQSLSWAVVLLTVLLPAPAVFAAEETSATDESLQVQEIVVTARRRAESLQNVPDSVTAFTAANIVNAGISQIGDFAALTPNLTFQEGSAYRAGLFNLSMRGIGNGQEGWPSVSFLVDGVPADSTDSINSGSLDDVERIEVLRGPQSALYGFNAIAGAINIITRKPTNDQAFEVRALYGNGNDRQISAAVSGPIIQDRLLFRLSAGYRDDAGLIESASNGLDLAFQLRKQANGRLLFTPVDGLEFDLHANIDVERNGSSYNDKLPSSAYLDDFGPAFQARRGLAGAEDRNLYQLALRAQWDLRSVSLISVTGFSHVDQNLISSVCYDDPGDPALPAHGGGAQCLFGPAFGQAALPGQAIDDLYNGRDDFRTVTEDLRLESRGNQSLQWTLGASALHRTYLSGFDAGLLLAPDDSFVTLYPTWNLKKDRWWGTYGQLTWKVAPKWELTAAGRYDREQYANTGYTDRSQSVVIPVLSENGTPIDTQHKTGNAFQPKGQASYHFTDEVMGYVTVSRGFRAGYFSSGSFTLPEHTTNYELGVKSLFLERRIEANAAAFHIDYSDQQFSTITTEAPYRLSVTIPKTRINGLELESTFIATSFLNFSMGMGYLDAKVADGTTSPAAPRFNMNASADFAYPIVAGWKAALHVDDRFNTSQYLSTGNTQQVPEKNYVNLRAGVRNEHYDIMGFVKNLTDERQATYASVDDFTGGYPRYQNLPRSYGIEVRAFF